MSANDINDILNDSSLTVVQKYQRIYGETVSRDTARHRLEKLKRQVSATNIVNVPKFRKVSVNEDGSQSSERLIECAEACLKDPEYLLKIHGYDVNEFRLVSAQSSIWQGGVGGKVLYSSKIRVSPLDKSRDISSLVRDTLSILLDTPDIVREVSPVDKVTGSNDKLLEICVPDLHIGLTNDYLNNGSIFIDRLCKCVDNIVKTINERSLRNVRIVFLGDIFHYDTAGKTTTKGTIQESNMVFSTAYEQAVEILSYFIRSIKAAASNVEVLYVPGNHDTVIGFTLMKVMSAYFSRDGIIFNICQDFRPFKLFGVNLIGYTHGDMDKKRLSQWIYSEARDYISDAKNIEIHVGHLHHEETIEENGVIVRYLPTIAGSSSWEYKKGYNSKRKMEIFIWDAIDGLESINYINV